MSDVWNGISFAVLTLDACIDDLVGCDDDECAVFSKVELVTKIKEL
jgi:hypothetical protein